MKRQILIPLAITASLLNGLLAQNEPHRPLYHFTPAKNWMNDPNGMVWHEGEWHLFYQYNPFGIRWGHMSWGHAVSRDLLAWEHLPLALPEENGIMIFSGSAVVDYQNTSGFGKDGQPPMVAIYTAHTETNQSQAIAYSTDNGRSWTKFAGNPVLDIGEKDFRDPKVMWHEGTRRWIMTVSWPTHRKVRFYASPDLKKWTHLSDFGPAGSVSGIWECPDLLPLGEKWMLIVNVGSGAPAGGSGGQYFVGEFDGQAFRLDPSHPPSAPAVEPKGLVLADFEEGYGEWKAAGEAFGQSPAKGALGGQQAVGGFLGQGLVNSFLKGDAARGRLTSPEFTIDKDWLSFLIGGGAQPDKTCVNLLIAGHVARTATGRDAEALAWQSWSVAEWRGQKAVIEIVDEATGGWGHVNADHFVLSDAPSQPAREGALWLDLGPDFYAGVTWSGGPPGDKRRILLGWMSNWQYANDVPTSPWRSAMSVPREIALKQTAEGWRTISQPVVELAKRHDEAKIFPGGTVAEAQAWLAKESIHGDKLDLTLELTAPAAGACDLEVFAGENEATLLQIDAAKKTLAIDRHRSGKVGFHPSFTRVSEAALPLAEDRKVRLRVLLDACSVEVFAQDGLLAMTSLALPSPESRAVRIRGLGEGWRVDKLEARRIAAGVGAK